MAIISYCGAHVERFEEKYLSQSSQQFSTLFDASTIWLMMYQRLFECLGKYLHNRRLWVFQTCRTTTMPLSSPLYLSTTVEHLEDIFGPVWKTTLNTHSSIVMKYNVGLGYIIPWTHDEEDPPLEEEVYFCHWTVSVDDLDAAPNFPPDTTRRLLIGGTRRDAENGRSCRNSAMR